jgi:hypothetical protein
VKVNRNAKRVFMENLMSVATWKPKAEMES